MKRPRGLHRWITIGLLISPIGCAGNRIDAPYPQVSRSRHGLAIERQVGRGPLSECPIRSLAVGGRRQLAPIQVQAKVTLLIAPEYQFVQPLALYNTRWLDGHHGWAWEWRKGLGLGALGSWYDTRLEGGKMAEYLFQLGPSAGYIPFAPGDSWRVGAMEECGTWAENRPIRVLLFTVIGPEGAEYRGVSAYWRSLNQNAWVSFLGLGSSVTAQAEFLTILRTSR